MEAGSLLASAGINIGIALVMLSLFSVLKKQPFIAPVYFSRRIAAGEDLPIDRRFSLRRLLPSVSWIPRAFHISEDDVLRHRGLDTLVVLRLFKFGIKFFTVCSLLGLLILVPVNYASQQGFSSDATSLSMDLFTISNVKRGSNRTVGFIEVILQEFTAAFVSFKSRLGATLAAETQQHAHPLLWVTESAPEPNEVIWKNVSLPYRYLAIQTIAVIFAAAVLTIFFALPVTAVQGIVQFEKIQKWFPPAMAVQLMKCFLLELAIWIFTQSDWGIIYSSQGLSKSSCKCGFITENTWLRSNSKFSSCPLRSKLIYQQIQSGFFITYILTDGLSGFSSELLQLGLILWHCVRSPFNGDNKEDSYLFGFPYYKVIPTVSLAVLIGMVYAVIAPLLLPFLIIYFLLGYAVYVNQMQDVYATVYDTHGQYWPCIHHYIIVTIVLMQITMIGLFGLKSKPAASISTIVLVLFTVLFNEHCKLRFLPSFRHLPIQIAKEMDDEEELDGQMQVNHAAAINAYQPPWMRPVNFQASTSTEPLIEA